ncbi:MAG: hypothetical protein II919_05110 [Lachnospiraceae bacterium]|nr:hypothetical protein [Lachnospiraceae bacterium]
MNQNTNNPQKQTYFSTIILISLALILLLFPAKCATGVKLGIHIALYSLIPAILPFMIFSNYVILSGYSEIIGKLVHPVIHQLFKTSTNGSYAVLIGFLCGYPLGTKIICDLIKNNKISYREGAYLFCFANNPSLAFILCYAAPICFPDKITIIKALFLIYAPQVIIGMAIRKEDFMNTNDNHPDQINGFQIPFSKVLDDSIVNALTTTARLTGYIILFSILSSLISGISFLPYTLKATIPCILELTSGIYQMNNSHIMNFAKPILTIVFSIFGGMSVLFQISSILNSVERPDRTGRNDDRNALKISYYIKYKLFSILLCIIFFMIMVGLDA